KCRSIERPIVHAENPSYTSQSLLKELRGLVDNDGRKKMRDILDSVVFQHHSICNTNQSVVNRFKDSAFEV
ncbi:MAG: hypothetical protein ACMUIG_10315, partial [Thermoplasmatota archaeon]